MSGGHLARSDRGRGTKAGDASAALTSIEEYMEAAGFPVFLLCAID